MRTKARDKWLKKHNPDIKERKKYRLRLQRQDIQRRRKYWEYMHKEALKNDAKLQPALPELPGPVSDIINIYSFLVGGDIGGLYEI